MEEIRYDLGERWASTWRRLKELASLDVFDLNKPMDDIPLWQPWTFLIVVCLAIPGIPLFLLQLLLPDKWATLGTLGFSMVATLPYTAWMFRNHPAFLKLGKSSLDAVWNFWSGVTLFYVARAVLFNDGRKVEQDLADHPWLAGLVLGLMGATIAARVGVNVAEARQARIELRNAREEEKRKRAAQIANS